MYFGFNTELCLAIIPEDVLGLCMESTEKILQLENIDNTEIDRVLQHLVLFVDASDADYGITVQVGGNFISGRLISKKEYFIQNSEAFLEMAKSVTSDSLNALQKMFEDHAHSEQEWITLVVNGTLTDEADLKRKPHTLHLKKVGIYNNSFVKSFEIPLLRVKLSSIDSFFLGDLTG